MPKTKQIGGTLNKIIESLIESLKGKKFPGCRIFVLNTKMDEGFAKELIIELRKLGFLCWDKENCLLPGQDHKNEQEKAIFDSDFVIAIMSKATSEEEGRYAKLLKLAFEAQQEKSDGGIKLISVIISSVDLPYEYRKYKPLDLTDRKNSVNIYKSFEAEYARRKTKKIKTNKPEAIWI